MTVDATAAAVLSGCTIEFCNSLLNVPPSFTVASTPTFPDTERHKYGNYSMLL